MTFGRSNVCPIKKDLVLNDVHCEHFLRARRSIRRFKDKPVPREDIQRLIEIARYAPSGHNSQPVEWLVLGKRDELHKYAEIIANWMRVVIEKMPDLALPLHLDHILGNWDKGKDVILRDAPVIVVAHAGKENRLAPTACTIALTYLDLAATSMGLGCCWAGFFFHATATTYQPMMDALLLPEGHECCGAMMIGYPKLGYHRMPPRRPPHITWRL